MMKHKLMFIALSSLTVSAFAAVSAEEAKQLGAALTPFGAEIAGNKEGTIPAYTGEPIKAPAGYDPVNNPGHFPDPWNEKPLYTITAQNAAKYADKLDGWITVFKKYPNYRMDVYPTHRTANYPKSYLDNSIKNASSCQAKEGELVLEGCYGGIPFPVPKTGAQVMWNHSTSYQTSVQESRNQTWVVPPTSDPIMVTATHTIAEWPIYDAKYNNTPYTSKEVYWKIRSTNTAPARKVGEDIVLIDYVDSRGSRRAWSYIPGQRRVKLAPDLSYDTPGPWQGGYCTMDDGIVFLGPIDRFNWKLVGKKEKLINYHNFKNYNDPKTCPPEVQVKTKNFPNPDCVRWELHRVWVVEGTLKPEYRHIYQKRIIYWDEDFPSAGMAESYDAGGTLFRLSSNIEESLFNGQGQIVGGTYYLELNTGGYAFAGIGGHPNSGWWSSKKPDPYIYTAEAMAASGVR